MWSLAEELDHETHLNVRFARELLAELRWFRTGEWAGEQSQWRWRWSRFERWGGQRR
jgi:hypothetical protein